MPKPASKSFLLTLRPAITALPDACAEPFYAALTHFQATPMNIDESGSRAEFSSSERRLRLMLVPTR